MRRFGTVSPLDLGEPSRRSWFELVEPATGKPWAEAIEASPEDVDAVVSGAERAYRDTWSRVNPTQRGRLLLRWADSLKTHRDELAALDATDTGNLRSEAAGDVRAAIGWLRYYAGMADKLEGRSFPQYPGRLGYTVREPYGVVAGINAYNANTLMFGWKAGPALAAGNAFVLKAPELSPASSVRMGELAIEAGIPPGVVNVVTGRGAITGRALAEHPRVGYLAFTGSAAVAETIARQAAGTIKPLSFELGGKNAVIALADVDEDLFVPSLLHSNFAKAGQSCAAGSRIYVHASRYEEIAQKLAAAAAKITVGLPDDAGAQMGSLISTDHRRRVDAVLRAGTAAGAEVLAGGHPATHDPLPEGGAFYEPTIVAQLTDENVLIREEIFGPVVGVMPFDDLDEAIARANASEYGLTAQVWGDRASEIQHAVRSLNVGTVWVNMYRGTHYTAPYGGYKRSGYGRENGFEGIHQYTRVKSVMWDLTRDRELPYQQD